MRRDPPISRAHSYNFNVNFGSVEQLFFTIPLTHSQKTIGDHLIWKENVFTGLNKNIESENVSHSVVSDSLGPHGL